MDHAFEAVLSRVYWDHAMMQCTARAAADLMETASATHTSNPPRNGSHAHFATITIEILLKLADHITFLPTKVASRDTHSLTKLQEGTSFLPLD